MIRIIGFGLCRGFMSFTDWLYAKLDTLMASLIMLLFCVVNMILMMTSPLPALHDIETFLVLSFFVLFEFICVWNYHIQKA